MFILVLGLTRLLANGLERFGVPSLRPLLLLQLLLLGGSLASCLAIGSPVDPNAVTAIVAGMLGVSAMAVQNALVQISVKGAPSTAVMTTNITRLVMDFGEVLLSRSPDGAAQALRRGKQTAAAMLGFAVGCGLGAVTEMAAGLWAMALPTGLALVALVMALAARLDGRP